MRCPKCGYNSFDHLDSCKKCGRDLVEFKQRYGIRSVLFPGQMKPEVAPAESVMDSDVADAAVIAATGVAAAAGATVHSATEETVASTADGDDFGFDFMGDSTEDDDLSFDELFEEAPEDADVEETIEGPKKNAQGRSEETSEDDFSFDLPEDDDELAADFGFDPSDSLEGEAADPESEEDFSFNDEDEPDQNKKTEAAGTKEDPKSPFDLPESSQGERAPDESQDVFAGRSAMSTATGESGRLFAEESVPPVLESEPESYTFEPEDSLPLASIEQTQQVFSESPSVVVEALDAQASDFEKESTADHLQKFAALESAATVSLSDEVVDDHMVASVPSLISRSGAFLCDLVLLAVVGVSFVVVAEAAMSAEENRFLPSLETLIDLSIPYFLVLFSLAFGYFTLFHFLAGQTPGKMLTGLRVETTEGEPLAFAQAFLRSVGGLLQLLPVGLGYLVILISPEHRGWNDRLAGTRIVALKDLPEEA